MCVQVAQCRCLHKINNKHQSCISSIMRWHNNSILNAEMVSHMDYHDANTFSAAACR